jgi:hypothetical protein
VSLRLTNALCHKRLEDKVLQRMIVFRIRHAAARTASRDARRLFVPLERHGPEIVREHRELRQL